MKKAILVFEDRSVYDVTIDLYEKLVRFRGSEYRVVQEEDYYTSPSLDKNNSIYIRSPSKSSRKKKGIQCPYIKEIS